MAEIKTMSTIEALELRILELEELLDQRPRRWGNPHQHRRDRQKTSATVSLIPMGDAGVLQCPRCRSEDGYLHHNEITVFDRGEDDVWTEVTTVQGGRISSHRLPSRLCDNPSSRRDGIRIGFWCEVCGPEHPYDASTIWLEFAQHKGNTLVSWRFDPDEAHVSSWGDQR